MFGLKETEREREKEKGRRERKKERRENGERGTPKRTDRSRN